jgi:DNA adenine methylase
MSRSIIRYPGGKTKSRAIFTALINEFPGREYREPFFGGGSVGLDVILQSNRPSHWVNDFDPGIAALWQAAAHHAEELKTAIMEFEPTVDAFDRLKAYSLSGPAMPTDAKEIVRMGRDKLALHRLSFGGLGAMAGGPLGGRLQIKGGIDSRWDPKTLCRKINDIGAHLSHVRITSVDFAKLIVDESQPAIIYLDPPYYVQGKGLYQHAFDDAEHRRLRDLLKLTSHQWILSCDDCAEIRDLYAFAEIRRVELPYSMARRGKRPELIIGKPTAQTSDVFKRWKPGTDRAYLLAA